jgi:hypothetical protein
MFPDTARPPITLSAWVQIGSVTFQAEIIDADQETQTAQVIRLGTLFEQTIPYRNIASVALTQGGHIVEAFGRPRATIAPAWAQYAQVQP